MGNTGGKETFVENQVGSNEVSEFTYTGNVKNSRRHGQGKLTWRNLMSNVETYYDGEWKEGKQHGQGTLTFENGNTFTGTFVRNNINGKGELKTSNGEKVEGDFRFVKRLMTRGGPGAPVSEYYLTVTMFDSSGHSKAYTGPATLHLVSGMLFLHQENATPTTALVENTYSSAVVVLEPVEEKKESDSKENGSLAVVEAVPIVQAQNAPSAGGIQYGLFEKREPRLDGIWSEEIKEVEFDIYQQEGDVSSDREQKIANTIFISNDTRLKHPRKVKDCSKKGPKKDSSPYTMFEDTNHHEKTRASGANRELAELKSKYSWLDKQLKLASKCLSSLRDEVDQKLDSESTSCAKKSRKVRKKYLSKTAISFLRQWFEENIKHPYPKEEKKREFSKELGVSVKQITTWFINERNRKWDRNKFNNNYYNSEKYKRKKPRLVPVFPEVNSCENRIRSTN
eukprot:augustus_masked-scaffold_41-processed-gene-2.10-mRNA-1 protein AED:0.34 eAED:0.34 QI:0/0/0/1/1/1/2/0/452